MSIEIKSSLDFINGKTIQKYEKVINKEGVLKNLILHFDDDSKLIFQTHFDGIEESLTVGIMDKNNAIIYVSEYDEN